MSSSMQLTADKIAGEMHIHLNRIIGPEGDRQFQAVYELRRLLSELVIEISKNDLCGLAVCKSANNSMMVVSVVLKSAVRTYEFEVDAVDVGLLALSVGSLIEELRRGRLDADLNEMLAFRTNSNPA